MTNTHPADTSEELRDILAQEFSANGESGYADAVFGGKSDPIIKAALAAMSRARSTTGASVPPPPDRGMVEESLSDTGELLRQAEVAALEWLNCDRYSKRLGALRALPDCDDTNGRKNVALRMLRAVRASTASQPQPERLSMVDGHLLTEADNG